MKYLMDIIYVFAAAGYSPILLYRSVRYKRYRTGWPQRFGKIKRKHPEKKSIWLHAVSVGEINAARTIIDELSKKFTRYEILITTTTDTGFARANALYGSRLQVCYFPLDFSRIMRRAFSAINPAVCILMELEVWPNLVQIAAEHSVPVIVANGRLSERSTRRYMKVRPFVKKMFQNVAYVLAQTEQYAQRFKQLGCSPDKVLVTGSLKYDTAQITDKVEDADTLAEQLFGKFSIQNPKFEIPLWVAGGTGNDEEAIILDVYKKLKAEKEFENILLAIVPRKPERFDEVANLIKQNGFTLIRYSEIKNAPEIKLSIINHQSSIVLGDTMGDLRKFYSLATVIFVGRTLVPMGGSDMMEAAALEKCTIFGPHAFNFRQTVNALLADNGAILVNDADELYQAMHKCLTDVEYKNTIARNGQNVIRKNQGATEKTIAKISSLLGNSE
ncbi:MAG: 3-deoxy-D-manno-octulosonic acid transferase [Phycisphaerae bacterium]|jgi:3-deoxy-D-manno-octulosonic-acid transferase